MGKIIKSSDNSMVTKLTMADIAENVTDNLIKFQHEYGVAEYYISDEKMAKLVSKLDFVKVEKEGNQFKVSRI